MKFINKLLSFLFHLEPDEIQEIRSELEIEREKTRRIAKELCESRICPCCKKHSLIVYFWNFGKWLECPECGFTHILEGFMPEAV